MKIGTPIFTARGALVATSTTALNIIITVAAHFARRGTAPPCRQRWMYSP